VLLARRSGARPPSPEGVPCVAVVAVGFVGAGLVAGTHAGGIRAMIEAGVVDASVVAVYDADAARAERFAASTGAAVVAGFNEVLERCDAVWICTPTAAHRVVAEAAAARGRAVFCEKPLATDLEGARALARAVTRSGAPAQVGLVLRSAPVFRRLKETLATGELGRPMTAVLRDDQYFPVQGIYASTWRSDVTMSGGGCLIEHSIHDVDILRFCLGEVVEVACRTASFSGHEGVEDLAAVSLLFESGATAEVVSVWHGILSRGSTRRLELFCERGMAWLEDDFSGPLHVQTSDEVETRPCPPPRWVEDLALRGAALRVRPYVEADRAFLDAVSAGRRPEPSLDEAVIAHRIVDAAYRSAAAGAAPLRLTSEAGDADQSSV
jgi:predicted dehydrogenase